MSVTMPSASSAYRSPTERVTAEILLANGQRFSGDVHLQANSQYPSGFETPLALLNRPERFFAVSGPEGQTVLLAKARAALVSCDRSEPLTDPERLSAAASFRLRVEVAADLLLEGTAKWELPPDHSRALDFLNASDQFFALIDDRMTHHINRAHVLAVHPLD